MWQSSLSTVYRQPQDGMCCLFEIKIQIYKVCFKQYNVYLFSIAFYFSYKFCSVVDDEDIDLFYYV